MEMRLLREASDLHCLGLLARKIRSLAGSQSMPVGLGPYVWAVRGSLAREAWLSGVLGKGVEKGGRLSELGRQNWGRHRSRKSLVLHLGKEKAMEVSARRLSLTVSLVRLNSFLA